MNNNTEREFKEGTNKERKDMRYYQEKYFRFGVYVYVHFTELSGHHSVLERPLSEVNGRLFFS